MKLVCTTDDPIDDLAAHQAIKQSNCPVKVLPVEGNDFLYLVLPVRFKND